MDTNVYPLRGDERVEVVTEKVPCGDCITTTYFDAQLGSRVRQDIEVKVDPAIMMNVSTYGRGESSPELREAVRQFEATEA